MVIEILLSHGLPQMIFEDNVTIVSIGKMQIDEVVDYVRSVRRHLFPMLDHDVLPRDLCAFEETYIKDKVGVFLVARDSNDTIVGTIGMLKYDGRFTDHFNFGDSSVTEVVKLFVEPHWRRRGLASYLVQCLKDVAAERDVQNLYMHTHPFLPGAEVFWAKQSFNNLISCVHDGLETIHMVMQIES